MDPKPLSWEDIPEDNPIPLLSRRRFKGERMMLASVVLKKGCHVHTHQHDNEQIACVMRGQALFGPGEVLHLPSNLPHSVVALEDTRILDLFSPPTDQMGVDDQGRG